MIQFKMENNYIELPGRLGEVQSVIMQFLRDTVELYDSNESEDIFIELEKDFSEELYSGIATRVKELSDKEIESEFQNKFDMLGFYLFKDKKLLTKYVNNFSSIKKGYKMFSKS